MRYRAYQDFLSAVGASFCDVLSEVPGFEDASPHDYQQVLLVAVADPLSREALTTAMSAEGIASIVAECERYFEMPPIAGSSITEAIERALWRTRDDAP